MARFEEKHWSSLLARYRERRRDGLRCLTIEIRETEIDVLIGKGMLKADARNYPDAIRDALYAHLDRTLDEMPWRVTEINVRFR
jgi:hypothetical protein